MSTCADSPARARATRDSPACPQSPWAHRRTRSVVAVAASSVQRRLRAWAARPSARPSRRRSRETSAHCPARRRRTAWQPKSRCRFRSDEESPCRTTPPSSTDWPACAPCPWACRSSRMSTARSRDRRPWSWRVQPAAGAAAASPRTARRCAAAPVPRPRGSPRSAAPHGRPWPSQIPAPAAWRRWQKSPARGCSPACRRSRRQSARC